MALAVLLRFLVGQAHLNAERGSLLAGALILFVSTPLLMLGAHALGSAVISVAVRRFRLPANPDSRKENHVDPEV